MKRFGRGQFLNLMKTVFYDGECGICNQFVQFLLDRDHKHQLCYAPLQGETARKTFSVAPDVTTVIFRDRDKNYFKSGAALRSMAVLGGPWRAMLLFLIVPPFIRNAVYDFVANHRHRLGGGQMCRLPTPEERKYFLP